MDNTAKTIFKELLEIQSMIGDLTVLLNKKEVITAEEAKAVLRLGGAKNETE